MMTRKLSNYVVRYVMVGFAMMCMGTLASPAWATDCHVARSIDLMTAMQQFADTKTTNLCTTIILTSDSTPFALPEPLVFKNEATLTIKAQSGLRPIISESSSFTNKNNKPALINIESMKGGTIVVSGVTFSTKTVSGIAAINSSKLKLENISFDDMNSKTGAAILFDNTDNSTVSTMTLENIAGDGIVLKNGSTGNTLSKVTVSGSLAALSKAAFALRAGSNNNTLSSITVSDFGGEGVRIDDSNNNQVKGTTSARNLIQSVDGSGIVFSGSASDNQVSFTSIVNFGADGFGIDLSALDSASTQANFFDDATTRITLSGGIPEDESPYLASSLPDSALFPELTRWTLDSATNAVRATLKVSGTQVNDLAKIGFYLGKPTSNSANNLLYACDFGVSVPDLPSCTPNPVTTATTLSMEFKPTVSLQPGAQLYAVLWTGDDFSNPSLALTANEPSTEGEGNTSATCDPVSGTWSGGDTGDVDQDGLANVGNALYKKKSGDSFYYPAAIFDTLNATEDVDARLYSGEDANRDCIQNAYAIKVCENETGCSMTTSLVSVSIVETNPKYWDSDRDCIADSVEFLNDTITKTTAAMDPDSDDDQLPDGPTYTGSKTAADCPVTETVYYEDRNLNGLDSDDPSSFLKPDTDDDGLNDFVEVSNGQVNGQWVLDPRNDDTDRDGTKDGVDEKPTAYSATFKYCDTRVGHLIGITNDDTDDDLLTYLEEDKDEDCRLDTGESNPDSNDTDGDKLDDYKESLLKTNPQLSDTDSDGLSDGTEDQDKNGVIDLTKESSPLKNDTDGDGLLDGVEDADKDGIYDADPTPDDETVTGETAAYLADTDNDGLSDGVEDRNHNGKLDTGETDPRTADAGTCLSIDATTGACLSGYFNPSGDEDGDTISNSMEDQTANGVCDADESCFSKADTDGDSIPDQMEDRNKNGVWDQATESSAYLANSDTDLLSDSQEDINKNGIVDAGETDPKKADSDGDGIPDDRDGDPLRDASDLDTDLDGISDADEDQDGNGYVGSTESDPKKADSDGDGLKDGEEDKNLDGVWDSASGETMAYRADSDNDGLNDYAELRQYRTDPLDVDSDGDTLSDYEEVMVYKTNPLRENNATEVVNGSSEQGGCSLSRTTDATPVNASPMMVVAMMGFAIMISVRSSLSRRTKEEI